jgi:hypothetical protein
MFAHMCKLHFRIRYYYFLIKTGANGTKPRKDATIPSGCSNPVGAITSG